MPTHFYNQRIQEDFSPTQTDDIVPVEIDSRDAPEREISDPLLKHKACPPWGTEEISDIGGAYVGPFFSVRPFFSALFSFFISSVFLFPA